MTTKIKMLCGKTLRLSLVAAAFALAGSGVANATLISQTFLSGVEGGIVTYDDNLGSNQLRLTFNNTSSMWNGAITGLVFNVSADIVAASVLSFVDGNNAAITGWLTLKKVLHLMDISAIPTSFRHLFLQHFQRWSSS